MTKMSYKNECLHWLLKYNLLIMNLKWRAVFFLTISIMARIKLKNISKIRSIRGDK